ncbi:MAG: formaldehyde-activating enzyme [Methylococcaceae bacterium]
MNTYSGNLNTYSGKSRKVFSLKPESVFNLFQNRCSDWSRMGVQVEPEYAAQRGVAMAVADCVEDGTIPADEADDLFICVGVFIHWQAEDDALIEKFNYQATKEALKRAIAGSPTANEVIAEKSTAKHPFAVNSQA